MDRSEAKAIVEREIEVLLPQFGLEHWKIAVSYNPERTESEGHLKHGECTRLLDYESAHISLNPESFDDQDDVLRTLRHELFHVVLSPFDLFSSSVDRLDVPSSTVQILERVWGHACERAVINLERMYAGISAKTC